MTAVLFLGVVTSCEMFDDLLTITFETDYTTVDFTVNPASAGEHTLVEKVLQSDIQAEIEEHGGDLVSLDEITVYEARLLILTDGYTFDTFEWVEVYVETEEVAQTLIGSATLGEGGLVEVKLDLTETDLSNIIEAEEYTVTIVGSLADPLEEPVDMQLMIKYQVVV